MWATDSRLRSAPRQRWTTTAPRAFLAIAIVSSPSVADAQAVDGAHASVGTLAAAAFETAGYMAQAKILRDLNPLIENVAALVYLCIVISAIVTIALGGEYKAARWILIGPPLFFFMINGRVQAAGAEWQLGEFKDRRRDLDVVLKGANVRIDGTVSRFFHQYNVLVSEMIADLVDVITNRSMLPQMRFMARQRTMDHLYGAEIREPGLIALARFMYVHCHREIGDAALVALGNREKEGAQPAQQRGFADTPEYAAAVKRYCEGFPRKDKPFPPGPWQDYVTRTLERSPAPPQPRDQFINGRLTVPVSCAQIWSWTLEGARREVDKALTDGKKILIEPYADDVPGFWPRVQQDIAAKMINRAPAAGPGDPCPVAAIVNFNEQFQATALHRIFAAYLIRRNLLQDPRGQMMQQFVDHSGVSVARWAFRPGTDPAKKDQISRRYRAAELAESQKYEALVFINTLPYVQGIFLFALAALFPFFAMTLLVPGQPGAFLAWCALWAWAKSWDVGWALVMVADNVLWEMLPVSAYYDFPADKPEAGSIWDSPVNLLEGAFSGDYSYSLGAYWVFLSLMVGAVPILSAQVVMGTKRAIAGVVIDGMRGLGSKLGGSAADHMAQTMIERNDARMVREVVNDNKGKLNHEMSKVLAELKQLDEMYGDSIPMRLYGNGLMTVQYVVRGQAIDAVLDADRLTNGEVLRRWTQLAEETHDARERAAIAARQFDAATAGERRQVADTVNAGAERVEKTVETAGGVGAFLWNNSPGVAGLKRLGGPDLTTGNPAAGARLPRVDPRDLEAARVVEKIPVPQKYTRTDLEKQRDKEFGEAAVQWQKTLNGWMGLRNQAGFFLSEVLQRAETFRFFVTQAGIELYDPTGMERRNNPLLDALYHTRLSDNELERLSFGAVNGPLLNFFLPAGPVGHPAFDREANEDLNEFRRELEKQRMTAYHYRTGAEVTAYGSVVIGVGVGFFDPEAGVTVGLTGLHAAYQMNSTGIDLHRLVNQGTTHLLQMSSQVWLYEYSQTEAWQFRQEIRAMLSLRGEWWNVPEAPYLVPGNVKKLIWDLRREGNYLEGQLAGDLTWTVIMGVTKGKATRDAI